MQSFRQAIGVFEHVGLILDDLDAARRLFHETLRLPVTEYPNEQGRSAFAVRAGGTTIRVASPAALESKRARRGWHHLAFKVPSLLDAKSRLERGGLRFPDGITVGSGGRKALWSDPDTSIGIPLQFVEQDIPLSFVPPKGDMFIERVDHLGVASRDLSHARHVYMDTLGYPLECTQIDSEVLIRVETTSNDKYGATSHSHPPIPTVGSGLAAVFITVGDFELEIMQPLSPAKSGAALGSIPGSVGQDQGAIARFLERRGEGLLHLCFKTSDIKRAIEEVAAKGIGLIDRPARPGGRAGLISFMDRRTTEGILMHFVERTPL